MSQPIDELAKLFARSTPPGWEAQVKMAPHPYRQLKERPLTPIGAKEAGVLVVLYPEGNDIFLPLIQRPSYNGPHSGQISLPGGKREEIDKDIIDTALRETNEELGIRTSDLKIIGRLSDLWVEASNHIVTPSIALCQTKPNFYPDKDEVSEVITTSIEHLLLDKTMGTIQIPSKKRGYFEAPYFNISNKVVWGATAMILSELKEWIYASK